MSDKYNIEYLIRAKNSLYLEVECSIAEDIDCAIQWAINRIKQLKDINTKLAEQLEASMGDYTDANKKIKQLEDGISNISTEVFKIWEYNKRQNDPNPDSYLKIYDDLKALEGK